MRRVNKVKSGENQESARRAEQDGAAQGGSVSKPIRLVQPTLDFQNSIWLNGKKDKIKGLQCITVRFYPGGMHEVVYSLEDEDGVVKEVGPSGLNTHLRAKAREDEQANEVPAAAGFAMKFAKRCFVEIPSDPPSVRKVQAGEFPAVAAKVMRLTQAEVADKKLNEPGAFLHFWSKIDTGTQAKMDEFQETVYPGAEQWSSRIQRLCEEEVAAKVESEKKKAAKAAGILAGKKKKDGTSEEEASGKGDPPEKDTGGGGGGQSKPTSILKDKSSQGAPKKGAKWADQEEETSARVKSGKEPPERDSDVL